MLNAENIKDAEQRRLAWRCRRGMLELDIVLQRFVATQFNTLTLAELHAFDEMLALPDNDFWALMNAPEANKNAAIGDVVNKIKTALVMAEKETA